MKKGEGNHMINRLWIRFLWRLVAWMCRRLQGAIRREKLRWLKRELERRDLWKN